MVCVLLLVQVERGDEEDQLVLKTPIDDSYEEETGEMVIIIDKVTNSCVDFSISGKFGRTCCENYLFYPTLSLYGLYLGSTSTLTLLN